MNFSTLILKNSKEPGSKTQQICGVLFIFLTILKALIAQYHVDLWIFQKMKIKAQKVKGTVRKMLWIFSIYSSNSSLSLETLITQVDVDLWIFETQYIKTKKLKETGRKT